MPTKLNVRQLEQEYKSALENAYNLQYTAPSESDYFTFEAEQLYKQILLLDAAGDQNTMEVIA
ncbi:Lacal_2735 family protein [Leeuwenhoekiella sp. A16]|uniref:Lacal_2735 family protein n=1 Tax=unclassified Leeuwenhoekiella TaxID=2615029 RepID=UPI003A80CAAF